MSIKELIGYTSRVGAEDIQFGTGLPGDTFTTVSPSGGSVTKKKMPSLDSFKTSFVKGVWHLGIGEILDHGATSGTDWDAYNLARVLSEIGASPGRIHAPRGALDLGGRAVTIPGNIEFTFDYGFSVTNGSLSITGRQEFGELIKQAAALPGSISGDVIDALRKLSPMLADGKRYRISACVVRNTGGGWAFINDSEHAPIAFTAVSVQSGMLRLDHPVNAKKVATLIIVPDETFASMGFTAGASVGLALSLVKIGAPVEFYLDSKTGSITAPAHWGTSITGAAGTGYCDVTHPACAEWDIPVISPAGATSFDCSDVRLSFASNSMRIIGAGDIEGIIYYNPGTSAWVYSGSMYNAPTMVFAAGALTVSHVDAAVGSLQMTPYDGGYLPKGYSAGKNSFSVKFYNAAGTQITTPDGGMYFYFRRGGKCRRDDLRGTFAVRRGYAPINAANLASTAGNFWVIAIHEWE